MQEISINQLKTYFLIGVLSILILVVIASLYKEYLLNKKVVEMFTTTSPITSTTIPITTIPTTTIPTTTIPTTTIPTTTTPLQGAIASSDNTIQTSFKNLINNQMELENLTSKLNKLKYEIGQMGGNLLQKIEKENMKFY